MANTLIHESRRLLLPFDTVVDAIIELEIKHGRWPANAALVEVAMHAGEADGARSLVLSIRLPRQEGIVKRTYTLPLIAAAIVNYCLITRVPMPRSSTKTIEILPEGIALHLENTLMLQRRHDEAPPVKLVADSPDGPSSDRAAAEAPSAPKSGSAEAGAAAEPEAAPKSEPLDQPGAASVSETSQDAPQA